MILRALVLLLTMLNLGYLAWGQGWLQPYVMGPTSQREPQRLARQLHPEAIRVVSADEVLQSVVADKAAKPECLQSGVLDATQADKVRVVLQKVLPPQAWNVEDVASPPRWIIYMGKYANASEVDKKRAELAKMGVSGESLRNSALAPGLTLGSFDVQSQADAALKAFSERGVRTGRVIQEQPVELGFRLRLPVVDETLKAQLSELQAVLPAQSLQPCAAPSQ